MREEGHVYIKQWVGKWHVGQESRPRCINHAPSFVIFALILSSERDLLLLFLPPKLYIEGLHCVSINSCFLVFNICFGTNELGGQNQNRILT